MFFYTCFIWNKASRQKEKKRKEKHKKEEEEEQDEEEEKEEEQEEKKKEEEWGGEIRALVIAYLFHGAKKNLEFIGRELGGRAEVKKIRRSILEAVSSRSTSLL